MRDLMDLEFRVPGVKGLGPSAPAGLPQTRSTPPHDCLKLLLVSLESCIFQSGALGQHGPTQANTGQHGTQPELWANTGRSRSFGPTRYAAGALGQNGPTRDAALQLWANTVRSRSFGPTRANTGQHRLLLIPPWDVPPPMIA